MKCKQCTKCKHENLYYCECCQKVKCKDCGEEWEKPNKVQYWYPYWYPYYVPYEPVYPTWTGTTGLAIPSVWDEHTTCGSVKISCDSETITNET